MRGPNKPFAVGRPEGESPVAVLPELLALPAAIQPKDERPVVAEVFEPAIPEVAEVPNPPAQPETPAEPEPVRKDVGALVFPPTSSLGALPIFLAVGLPMPHSENPHVPEPEAIAALAIGIAGLLAGRMRRR